MGLFYAPFLYGKSDPSTQTELLRLSRTNFSESFQILVHLKVVRLFVESVLRYGLPANYIGVAIKVDTTSCRHFQKLAIYNFMFRSQSQSRRRKHFLCSRTTSLISVRSPIKRKGKGRKARMRSLSENIRRSWNKSSLIWFFSKYLGSFYELTDSVRL